MKKKYRHLEEDMDEKESDEIRAAELWYLEAPSSQEITSEEDMDEKESDEISDDELWYPEVPLSQEIRSEEDVDEKDNGEISVAQRWYPGEPLPEDIDWCLYYCISSEGNAICPTPPRVEFHASNPRQAYYADAACCCLSLFMPMTTLSFGVMPLLSYLSTTLSAPGFTASIIGAFCTYAVCCLPSFHNLACIPIHLLEGRHPEDLRLPFPFLLCCRFSIIDVSSRADGVESRGLIEFNRSPTVIVAQPVDEGLFHPGEEEVEDPVVFARYSLVSELSRHIGSCFFSRPAALVANPNTAVDLPNTDTNVIRR